ncbi:MAG: chloride channel protein [Deltaproteobacteria bacterium]|nr:MAG: chloride channel protein [Deltaproteobacteria bacterium]
MAEPPSRGPFTLDALRDLLRTPSTVLASWQDVDLQQMWRLLLQSLLVGALAGCFATLFFVAIEWAHWFALDELARLPLPRAGGEAHVTPEAAAGATRWWLVAVLPAAGALVAGLLVHYLAPAAAGPGGDAYIATFHSRTGQMQKRIPVVKAIASALTLGTGGAAGREGPTLQVSAGMGSLLARWLKLGPRERRILLVAGAAAGIGAMFRTPLGAALFAVEVLYRDDFESDALIPAIIASVTGYSIVVLAFGSGHVFATEHRYAFDPRALPLYGAMAVGLCFVGALFTSLLHAAETRMFAKLPVPGWARPAIGGLLLGLLALWMPQALGAGYGLAQHAITGVDGDPQGQRLWLVLFGLAALKMVAVSLTIGSGGAGGDMGPSLVIGALVGGGFGVLFHQLAPSVVPQPGAFALVGMAAFFGGIANVPISSLFMVCELAGSYDLLVPLMLAEAIAYAALRRVTLYRSQVRSRIESPAHRDAAVANLLRSIRAGDVIDRGAMLPEVAPGAHVDDVLRAMAEGDAPAVLVARPDGSRGIVSLDALRAALLVEAHPYVIADDVAVPVPRVRETDDLYTALRAFRTTGAAALPVCAADSDAVVGILRHDALDRALDRAVAARLDTEPVADREA